MNFRLRTCLVASLALIAAHSQAAEPSGPVIAHADAVAKVHWTNTPGPQSEEEGRIRRSFWQVPSPIAGQVPLKATTYRPKGPGPYPLAILLHGGSTDAEVRHRWAIPHFFDLAVFLVDRGYYVIAPQRRNYGDDPNPFAEDNGACGVADYRKALGAAAADGASTVDFMRTQAFIDPAKLLIVGHSAGGVSALAFGATNPKGLMGVISFAGGKGAKPDGNWRQNCHPENLAAAMKGFGAATSVPSLWIYAQNDLWIPPDFAALLLANYNEGSKGKATLVMTPPFGADGHYLVLQKEGAEIWRKPVADFLDKLEGKTSH